MTRTLFVFLLFSKTTMGMYNVNQLLISVTDHLPLIVFQFDSTHLLRHTHHLPKAYNRYLFLFPFDASFLYQIIPQLFLYGHQNFMRALMRDCFHGRSSHFFCYPFIINLLLMLSLSLNSACCISL